MIEYRKIIRFTNDVGEFEITAYTSEHPSAYGNGTMLRIDVVSTPPIYSCKRMFDIRYEDIADANDVDKAVRELIRRDYGVEIGEEW